jgi:hypothetical protein
MRGQHAEAERWLTLAEQHVGTRTRSKCLATHWGMANWLSGQEARASTLAHQGLQAHPVADQPWAWFSLVGLCLNQFVAHPNPSVSTSGEAVRVAELLC